MLSFGSVPASQHLHNARVAAPGSHVHASKRMREANAAPHPRAPQQQQQRRGAMQVRPIPKPWNQGPEPHGGNLGKMHTRKPQRDGCRSQVVGGTRVQLGRQIRITGWGWAGGPNPNWGVKESDAPHPGCICKVGMVNVFFLCPFT